MAKRHKPRPARSVCMTCIWSLRTNTRICLRETCVRTGIKYALPRKMHYEFDGRKMEGIE